MSRARFGAVVWILCLTVSSVIHGQQPPVVPAASVPRVVRIDGQFVPANGLPPSPVEVVTLSLYASESSETSLWEETQDVRLDAQGRYAIFLGATRAEGLPVSLLVPDEARWLGMRFARPGEGEQARVLLTSVPYALRASDADTLGGLPPSAFLRADGTKEGAPLTTAGGASSKATHAPDPSTSTGTANYIGKFTNAVDLTSSALFDIGGRVGLGTTAPLDFLHSKFTDTTGSFTGMAVQNLGSGATSYSGMLFYDQNGALGQFQGFNNSTHEYRINNIASGGTINFMLGGTSNFLVRNDGDIDITGALRRNGQRVLQVDTAGNDNNVLVGALGAIRANFTVGSVDNTAVGTYALQGLTAGGANTALGSGALRANNNSNNLALGAYAMQDSTGFGNIALGRGAASTKVSGDFNMYLGYLTANSSLNIESNTIRIGDSGTYSRFFAGAVRGVTTSQANAVAVVIDSSGQLGTVNSSRRYKEDIQDMGDASSGLMRLRPVTYRYQQAYANGTQPLDYGLIAEEVQEVYPDLVPLLANGDVETVQYHKINAMLLNEVQKQHRKIEDQQSELADLKARLATLERLLTTEKK